LYEEFNEEFLGIIPGLTWTEIVISEAASGISVAETDGSPSSSGITPSLLGRQRGDQRQHGHGHDEFDDRYHCRGG
jgi:hypothetical protein